ncbi:MAG TPA: plastocyanin/azurin family copper-binding protein [Acidimicrobiia bacterium]|nr:plastocyanin/azurin family copper-binding protein [Acidimicrobiia bacterium]
MRPGGVAAALVLLSGLLVAVASSTAAPTADASVASASVTAAPAGAPEFVTVDVRDNVFMPKTIEVDPGTVVRWVNGGRNRHNVKPDAGTAFGSRNLRTGQSYSFEFEKPGTFGYYCSLHGAPGKGQHGTVVVGDSGYAGDDDDVLGARDDAAPVIAASGHVIDVPSDAKTIQAAVDRAEPGDLVLIAPGVYKESVTVSTDGVVLRGVDRNRTILDGEFKRENGVKVVGADGVAIENLTARNYTFNGFYWTGVLGYRGSYLTAYRNGDYGLFAFDSQWGTFEHSYASGSPDSGFYIGQCNPCHAVIDDVLAEHNQLGYSGTNASGDLHIVQSVWRSNRAGIVPNSLDSEALAPQADAVIAANRVEGSGTSSDRAAGSGGGFDVVFGSGIALVGGSDDQIVGNAITDSATVGIAIAPNPGLLGNSPYPAAGNTVRGNTVERSGVADLAVVLPAPDDANCFAGNTFTSSAPTGIEALLPCGAPATSDPATAPGGLDVATFLDVGKNPAGTPYKQTPVPPKQRNLPKAKTAKARPAGAPVVPTLASLRVPS